MNGSDIDGESVIITIVVVIALLIVCGLAFSCGENTVVFEQHQCLKRSAPTSPTDSLKSYRTCVRE